MATAAALAGASIATFVTLVATSGCQTPTVRESVSVFCTTFKPILQDQEEELDKLPLSTAERIIGHNAAYKELCVKKGIFKKIRDAFKFPGTEKD